MTVDGARGGLSLVVVPSVDPSVERPLVSTSHAAVVNADDLLMPLVPPSFDNVVIRVNHLSFSFNTSCPPRGRPIHPFRFIKHLLFDLDTLIPSYLADESMLYFY